MGFFNNQNQVDIYKQIAEINNPTLDLLKPHQIKNKLDEDIIGNESTKMILSTSIYNHYKKISYSGNIEMDKSNILLLGPTGSGKTYLIKKIAKLLNIPYYIGDATVLTASGYVGSDVESLLTGLLERANGNIQKAQIGLIVIDEIDKLGRKSENPSITRDVSGEDVQGSLLKMLEGSIVKIQPGERRQHPEKQFIDINTENILFIGMGSFEGIENKIKKRLNLHRVGYTTQTELKSIEYDEKNILKHVNTEDLRSFGLIPELIGRLPIIVTTEHLSEEALVKIITEPKNAILKQYKELFKMDGCVLSFDDAALIAVAKHAIKLKTGARSLRTILEKVLQNYMYDIPKKKTKKLNITEEIVNSLI